MLILMLEAYIDIPLNALCSVKYTEIEKQQYNWHLPEKAGDHRANRKKKHIAKWKNDFIGAHPDILSISPYIAFLAQSMYIRSRIRGE